MPRFSELVNSIQAIPSILESAKFVMSQLTITRLWPEFSQVIAGRWLLLMWFISQKFTQNRIPEVETYIKGAFPTNYTWNVRCVHHTTPIAIVCLRLTLCLNGSNSDAAPLQRWLTRSEILQQSCTAAHVPLLLQSKFKWQCHRCWQLFCVLSLGDSVLSQQWQINNSRS